PLGPRAGRPLLLPAGTFQGAVLRPRNATRTPAPRSAYTAGEPPAVPVRNAKRRTAPCAGRPPRAWNVPRFRANASRMAADPLRELCDRAAIHDLLMRYARGVDRRDLDQVAACFAPDAGYEGSLGVGTIDVALAALRERMDRYQVTMHFLANEL